MNGTLTDLLNAASTTMSWPDSWDEFIICISFAVILGLSLQLLYSVYFRDNEPQDGSVARSMVLLVPALAAIFWLVQSSLVLTLGMLGCLSIVRFRTPVKRSEDIAFVLIGLAVALACSVGQAIIGAILVGLLFTYALFRTYVLAEQRFSWSTPVVITFNTQHADRLSRIIELLQQHKLKPALISSRTYDGLTSYVFHAHRLDTEQHAAMCTALKTIDAQGDLSCYFPNGRLGG